MVKQALRAKWQTPGRCKDAAELKLRLPEWISWLSELEKLQGCAVDDDTRFYSLD